MKKKMLLLLVAFCCFSLFEMKAQIRHVEGMKALEVGGVYTDLGVGASVGYLMYLKGNFSGYAQVSFDMGSEINNRDAFGGIVDVGVGYSVTTIGNNVFLNAYGGGSISYDQVANTEAYNVGNGVNYGVFITPEAEYFVNDTFSILLKSPIRYYLANSFGGLRVGGNLGVRYNF